MTTNPTVDTGQPAFMDSGLAPSARPGTTRMSNKAPRSSFATIVARLSADEATAMRIANRLAEHLDPATTTIGTFEGPGQDWTVEICLAARSDQGAVRDVVARAAGKRLARKLMFEILAERDWVRTSLENLRPVEAGRFVVQGSHNRGHLGNRISIEIEAALAFGTGHHGTTRGCLLALDRIFKAHRPRRPRRVLDLGTGTGVLAIAAAKAVHARVLASDIDPIAVTTARENLRRNGTAPRVMLVRAAGVTGRAFRARAPFDLVLANLLLAPLRRLAFPLSRLLALNAYAILSGLLARQANAALTAYAAHGFRLEHRITLDGWTTLVLRRPS